MKSGVRLVERKKVHISPFEIGIFIVLSAFTLILLALFLWGLISSFREHYGVIEEPFKIFSGLSFDNYKILFGNDFLFKSGKMGYSLVDLFSNSFIYAVGGALAQTFCTAVVAYCTAKYPGKVSTFINYMVIVVTILPIVGNLSSMIIITRDVLHTYNTMFGAWIMKFGFCNVYYFIFYAAFKKISWEYAEAAFIDGANHFRVFFTIMLPLVGTLFGTVFLLNFIVYWNDFETPYMFLKNNPTASVGLFGLLSKNGYPVAYSNSVPLILGASFLVFLPILILFLVLRNKIMGNLSDGGIKG